MQRFGILVVALFIVGCGNQAGSSGSAKKVNAPLPVSDQSSMPKQSAPVHPSTPPEPKPDDPRVAKNDPRYKGRLLYQTLEEEVGAGEWKPPTGDAPVFTRDYLGHGIDLWLKHLAHLKDRPNVRGMEIGSFEGRSTIWFCQNVVTHETASLTCLDLFSERIDLYFDHNIKVTDVDKRVKKVKGRSQETLRQFPYEETFDFVYVDGCHLATCALVDIVLSFDLLKVGGLMIIDDYGWNAPELNRPKPAVDAFLTIYEPHIELIAKEYQVLVRKKSTAFPFVKD